MSALPRPEVSGAGRALNDALHELHHRAGWPSLRTMARETGVSHTTVSKVFSAPSIPPWGTLELLVEALDGDVAQFHAAWLAASGRADSDAGQAPGIAGRRAELATVRDHLESGTGLLLVAGEAGIGKTRLVSAAAAGSGAHVATGHCLPLSTDVPLLPVLDCLRGVHDVDAEWFASAVAACSPYVVPSLAALLPEVAGGTVPVGRADDRHLLLAAVGEVLRALSAQRRVTLLVEDLHWSDPTTLDLLEHLMGRSSAVPVLGTWRTSDDTTPPASEAWLARMRRLPGVELLPLAPLTVTETAEQLALLGVDSPVRCARIHARSQGQPLFTEQLAAHLDDAPGLPALLSDLLDRRLEGLSEGGWTTLRTLGVAERPLTPAQLAVTSAATAAELTIQLHALRDRRLVRATADERLELQHPLLADATRRRLVPGEAAEVHRALAEVLAADPGAAASEVARHWQQAGDPGRELEWRVRAARSSAAGFEWAQEAEHWLRALAVWPPEVVTVGTPPLERSSAYVAAIDALAESLQWDRAAAMSDAAEAELGPLGDAVQAELLLRAADYRGDREGLAVGLQTVDRALAIFAGLPVRAGRVRALSLKRVQLASLGRYDEATAMAREAVAAAEALGDPRLHRLQLARLAWHVGADGGVDEANDLLRQGAALLPVGTDPIGDIQAAVYATDLLLNCGGTLDAVESAARPGMDAARSWAIENESCLMLSSNLATARLRAGQVSRADAVVAVRGDAPPDRDRWPAEVVRAAVDARMGRTHRAAERIQLVVREVGAEDEIDLETLCVAADIEFWCTDAPVTVPALLRALDDVVDSSPARVVLPPAVAAARGAAQDCLDRAPGADRALSSAHDIRTRSALRVRPADRADPYVRAHLASMAAELARAHADDVVTAWSEAAGLWDRLGRPHDSAYCRWRAAQVALREGGGTVAVRLLARATRDAREHEPLSAAIAMTKGIPG